MAPQRRALVDGVLHRDRQQHHALPVVDVQLLHLRGWGQKTGQGLVGHQCHHRSSIMPARGSRSAAPPARSSPVQQAGSMRQLQEFTAARSECKGTLTGMRSPSAVAWPAPQVYRCACMRGFTTCAQHRLPAELPIAKSEVLRCDTESN